VSLCSKIMRNYNDSETTGSGNKTSRISNGSYKQIKKDTEKILLFVNNKYDAIINVLVKERFKSIITMSTISAASTQLQTIFQPCTRSTRA
jgi:hypothetical protein